MPAAEEITRVRALISRISAELDALPAAERAAVGEAVAVARRHRAVMLGMPRLPAPGEPYPAGQEEPA
jgi:chorismate mutase